MCPIHNEENYDTTFLVYDMCKPCHFVQTYVEKYELGKGREMMGGEGDTGNGENGRPLLWDTVGHTLVSTHPSQVQPPTGGGGGGGGGRSKSKESFPAGPIPTKVEDDRGEWMENDDGAETWNELSSPDNIEYSAGCSSWKEVSRTTL